METVIDAKATGRYGHDVESSVKILYENQYHNCIISSQSELKINRMIIDILKEIKNRNTKIENINDQMLPSIYTWQAEGTSVPTYCAEIDIGRFEEKASCISMFERVAYEVLTDSNARKPLSSNALKSLAMLSYMIHKEKDK